LDTLSDPGVALTVPIDELDMPKICHRSVLATDKISSIAVGLDNAGAVELLLNASKESVHRGRLSLCHPAGASPETTRLQTRPSVAWGKGGSADLSSSTSELCFK
jgi:ABC-type uncharacterized transport system permease subunit